MSSQTSASERFEMVEIYGPSCRAKAIPKDSRQIIVPALAPLLASAETLADALAEYSREYGVRFRAYDGSNPSIPFVVGEPAKYFLYEKADGTSHLVDIHISRGKEQICPKQDLSVPLLPGDQVHIGPLAC